MLPVNLLKVKPILARVGVWVLLVALLYLLRSFFLLIFLTFVFAFLQMRCQEKLSSLIVKRSVRVWLVGVTLLALITSLVLFLTPSIKKQTEIFVTRLDSYTESLDEQIYQLADKSPLVAQAIQDFSSSPEDSTGVKDASPSLMIAQQFLGLNEENGKPGGIHTLFSNVMTYSGKLLGVASAFLLSLLFSLLIVLDLPRLSRSVSGLRHSKLRFAYCEVAPSLFRFAGLLGKAMEAQFFVAIVNSLLTALGLWFLGLSHYLAFLSTIVFLFSFVPVAGVFISSIPICMVALQVGGLHSVMLAILMITGIHMMESYVLNPRIYGSHLRMNPVVVLVILTVGGKLFHFWGLVLGVPLCTWFFNHAIRTKRSNGRDVQG